MFHGARMGQFTSARAGRSAGAAERGLLMYCAVYASVVSGVGGEHGRRRVRSSSVRVSRTWPRTLWRSEACIVPPRGVISSTCVRPLLALWGEMPRGVRAVIEQLGAR